MNKLTFHQAEKVFWVGAILLFFASIGVGFAFGYMYQFGATFLLVLWGPFCRRYLSAS